MDFASRWRNLPWAVETAISGSPCSVQFLTAASRTSSLGMRKELWYLSERSQSWVNVGFKELWNARIRSKSRWSAIWKLKVKKTTCGGRFIEEERNLKNLEMDQQGFYLIIRWDCSEPKIQNRISYSESIVLVALQAVYYSSRISM